MPIYESLEVQTWSGHDDFLSRQDDILSGQDNFMMTFCKLWRYKSRDGEMKIVLNRQRRDKTR